MSIQTLAKKVLARDLFDHDWHRFEASFQCEKTNPKPKMQEMQPQHCSIMNKSLPATTAPDPSLHLKNRAPNQSPHLKNTAPNQLYNMRLFFYCLKNLCTWECERGRNQLTHELGLKLHKTVNKFKLSIQAAGWNCRNKGGDRVQSSRRNTLNLSIWIWRRSNRHSLEAFGRARRKPATRPGRGYNSLAARGRARPLAACHRTTRARRFCDTFIYIYTVYIFVIHIYRYVCVGPCLRQEF